MTHARKNSAVGIVAAASAVAALALLLLTPPPAPLPASEHPGPAIGRPAPPPAGEAAREDGAARAAVDLRGADHGLAACGTAGAARVPAWGRVPASAAGAPRTSPVPRHLLFCTWLV